MVSIYYSTISTTIPTLSLQVILTPRTTGDELIYLWLHNFYPTGRPSFSGKEYIILIFSGHDIRPSDYQTTVLNHSGIFSVEGSHVLYDQKNIHCSSHLILWKNQKGRPGIDGIKTDKTGMNVQENR